MTDVFKINEDSEQTSSRAIYMWDRTVQRATTGNKLTSVIEKDDRLVQLHSMIAKHATAEEPKDFTEVVRSHGDGCG